MRGAAALLGIALLLSMPVTGAVPSNGHAACGMSCCMAGAHACPMRTAGPSCRSCDGAGVVHASTIAKVVVAHRGIDVAFTAVGAMTMVATHGPITMTAPPPTPPPQRG